MLIIMYLYIYFLNNLYLKVEVHSLVQTSLYFIQN
jgi:hypothetical protein